MIGELCTGCGAVRPKGARWYWAVCATRPPIGYCGACATPEMVATRQRNKTEIAARTKATMARRRAR